MQSVIIVVSSAPGGCHDYAAELIFTLGKCIIIALEPFIQVYYGGKVGKCGKVCMGFSIVVVVLLSILFDVILALLCAIAFYIIGLVYIYCCMPLALVLQNTPANINGALRDLEQSMA